MADTERDDYLSLHEDFPVPSYEEWRAAVVESLGGKPFDKLVTTSYEGFALQPMYRREDTAEFLAAVTVPGEPPFVRGARAEGYLQSPWIVAQEQTETRPPAAMPAGAVGAINLVPDGPTRAGVDPDAAESGKVGRGGISLATVEDLTQLLSNSEPSETPIFLRSGTAVLPLLALVVAHLRQQGRTPGDLSGCLEADPLGELAEAGTLPGSLARAYDEMAHVTHWAIQNAPGLLTIAVHSYPYHEAGANAVQELAFGLATAVAYLRALGERGFDIADAAPRLRLDFAVGGNFFMEVAKLRAARRLWSQVVAAFGGDEAAQRLRLHGRTARRNKSAIDPHVNMLRVTTEALAAAVAGVDSLHVAPYDEPVRPADDFSRRIARNVQIILQEEAHLMELIDPAGGAYATEALTEALAREAWALFQEVERQGGMFAALQSGFIQAGIAGVADRRAAAVAKRRDILVGVNQFANPAERAAADLTDYDAFYRQRTVQLTAYRDRFAGSDERMTALELLAGMRPTDGTEIVEAAITAASAGATLGELSRALRRAGEASPAITPLHPSRAAEPFEALRAAARAYADVHGAPPRIFLANLGPPRQHKARADFSQGFFEVGGFQVPANNGFKTPEEAAAAALASGATAVVICSTDETYPDLVPPLAGAIKAASQATTIILAGRPADQVEAFRASGVDEFIYLGADALALNKWLLDRVAAAQSDPPAH